MVNWETFNTSSEYIKQFSLQQSRMTAFQRYVLQSSFY
jgi:hypothetical protein